jgi:hypothetical protein
MVDIKIDEALYISTFVRICTHLQFDQHFIFSNHKGESEKITIR